MTEKQKRFVEEYLIDLNATQAAIRAGYKAKNADVIGGELLRNTCVSEKIAAAIAERSKRTGVNQDRVVRELAKVAFANPKSLIDTSTGLIRRDASDEDMAAVQQITIKQAEGDKGSSYECGVRMCDKNRALELLGKHLGMWNDKINLNVSLPVVISGADDLED